MNTTNGDLSGTYTDPLATPGSILDPGAFDGDYRKIPAVARLSERVDPDKCSVAAGLKLSIEVEVTDVYLFEFVIAQAYEAIRRGPVQLGIPGAKVLQICWGGHDKRVISAWLRDQAQMLNSEMPLS